MKVGVVGATGMVGTEFLRLLDERNFPIDQLRVYASPRSEGRKPGKRMSPRGRSIYEGKHSER